MLKQGESSSRKKNDDCLFQQILRMVLRMVLREMVFVLTEENPSS